MSRHTADTGVTQPEQGRQLESVVVSFIASDNFLINIEPS